MPDISGLYAQPPQPGQGLLTGDPLRTIGAMGELQNIGIRAQQAPALSQLPAANLANTQIANQIEAMRRDDTARKLIATGFGNAFGDGLPHTQNELNNFTAYFARSNPTIPATAINEAVSHLLNNENGRTDEAGIGPRAAMLRNSVMSPESASIPQGVGYDPNTGQQITGSQAGFNVRAAGRGGIAQMAPPGTPESVAQMKADQATEGNYQQEIAPLEKSLALAEKLGPGVTAPTSDVRKKWEAAVYGLMPQLVPKEKQAEISNYEQLQKYLVRQAVSQSASLGPHSNAGLMAASTGNPNTSIIDLANIPLMKWLVGQRKFQHALVMQSAKSGGVNYSDTKARLSTQLDPSAFIVDKMSPEERTNYISSLSPGARQNFNASLQAGYDNQIVGRPGQ